MSLKIGIVGLPNVGKSTLFNALVKGSQAVAANYPFCTIEPNVGIVEVPDERLEKLAEISHSKKIVPAVIEFVDIAGLVRGASKGEGLGNKFLSHIRECDAIAMVVRFFEDDKVVHVANKIDPADDISAIETELQLADLETVNKRLSSLEKDIKAGDKDAERCSNVLLNIRMLLDDGKNARLLLPEQSDGGQARDLDLNINDLKLIKELGLMTLKPVIYIANCSEEQLCHSERSEESQGILRFAQDDNFIPISAKIEAELNELGDDEKKEYLKELGIESSGSDRLIKKAYEILGLISYLTSGEPETRAWTIHKGDTAPRAAGVIHGDFERGFIAADVVKYEDFIANDGWAKCRAKGLVKTQGKDYIMQDGDVVLFKFNV